MGGINPILVATGVITVVHSLYMGNIRALVKMFWAVGSGEWRAPS